MTCDFCDRPAEQFWLYPVGEFWEPKTRVHNQNGVWAACPACHPLVETRDLDGLLARFTEREREKGHADDPRGAEVRRVWLQVFRHRLGAPVAVSRDVNATIIVCKRGHGYRCSVCQRSVEASPEGRARIAAGALVMCNQCGLPFAEKMQAAGKLGGFGLHKPAQEWFDRHDRHERN